MELPQSSPLVLGLTEEGEPQRLSSESEGFASFIGFDPERNRLVEINRLGSEENLGAARWRSVTGRLALAKRIHHPSVSLIFDSDTDENGNLFYVTEFIEGEPLVDYLGRFTSLPENLGLHLALQLADTAGYLADFPRLLSTVSLDDFVVTLERGRFLSLRLSHLGFDREDAPVSDAILGAHWIEVVGHLLRHVIDRAPLPNPSLIAAEAAGNGSQLTGPLGDLIARLKSQPGAVAVRELRNLKGTLLKAAGFSEDTEFHQRPEFRAIDDLTQRPAGSLSLLITDSTEFEELTRDRWRLRQDGHPVDDASPFSFQARSPRDPSASLEERGQCYDLILLPPERLVGGTFLPRLNRQMGDPFLKEHPYLVRSRALVCDSAFTLIAAEGINGFSLMSLVTARGDLSPTETAIVLEEIVRLLAHLEGIDIELDRIDPWRLVFHFDTALGEERIRELLTTTPLTAWPPLTTKLRPVTTTDAMVDPEAGSWRYLCRRLGSKSLPALVAWMSSGQEFDRALQANRADTLSFSSIREISVLLEKARDHLDPDNPAHRQRFLEWFTEIANRITNSESASPESGKADSTESGPDLPKRRKGWRRRSPLSAA